MGTSRLPVFQERFKELRGEMTQGQFAEKLGLSRPTVGLYESGARIPDAEVLRDIAQKCNVPSDYLLGLTDIRLPQIDAQVACKYTGLKDSTVFLLHEFPEIGNSFSDIISEYGDEIANAFDLLSDAVHYAEEQHKELKHSIEADPDNTEQALSVCKRIIENLELAIFRFEKACRRVPDEVFETSHLLHELNDFVWEAQHGEHQED